MALREKVAPSFQVEDKHFKRGLSSATTFSLKPKRLSRGERPNHPQPKTASSEAWCVLIPLQQNRSSKSGDGFLKARAGLTALDVQPCKAMNSQRRS